MQTDERANVYSVDVHTNQLRTSAAVPGAHQILHEGPS